MTCAGCGTTVAGDGASTHPYIGASPGCWRRYAELLIRPTTPLGRTQLLVDAFAAQHAGVDGRRARQSVAVHLVGLCAVLERGLALERVPALHRRSVAAGIEWTWLDPPQPLGPPTDVLVGRDEPTAFGNAVHEYAAAVWSAYEPHHPVVRSWLASVTTPPPQRRQGRSAP